MSVRPEPMCRRWAVGLVATWLSACGPSTATLASTSSNAHRRPDTTTETAAETAAESAAESAAEVAPHPAQLRGVEAPDDPSLASPVARGSREPDPVLRAEVEILERRILELDDVVQRIVAAREAARTVVEGVPAACVDRAAIEALRIISTSGRDGLASAIAALRALEALCEPFDAWAQPTERTERVVARHLEQVDRFLSWLDEARRCARPGSPDAAQCANTFGDMTHLSSEAARIYPLLEAYLRELASVRIAAERFPCTSPTRDRLVRETWQAPFVRVQAEALVRDAASVCEALGLDDSSRRRLERRTATELDRAESLARSQRRTLLESLERLRVYLE